MARANGEPLAGFQGPLEASFDLAPHVTPEERSILRLIAAALTVQHY